MTVRHIILWEICRRRWIWNGREEQNELERIELSQVKLTEKYIEGVTNIKGIVTKKNNRSRKEEQKKNK